MSLFEHEEILTRLRAKVAAGPAHRWRRRGHGLTLKCPRPVASTCW